MRRLVLVVFLALACGPLAVHAQTLALAYHSGDAYKYAIHTTATETIDAGAVSMPVTFDVTASETVTVQSVDAGGVADLSITLSNLTIKSSANGVTNTTTGPPTPAIEIRIATDGRTLTLNGNAFGGTAFTAFSGLGGSFISAVLPDKAVKPGDTWSKDYDQANPSGSGSIHVTTKSKYLRDESVNGVNAAVVETTSTLKINLTIDLSKLLAGVASTAPAMPIGTGGSLTITGTNTSDVTTWIDPGGHRVLKSHMTGSTDAAMTMKSTGTSTVPGLTGPISVKGTQTLSLDPA